MDAVQEVKDVELAPVTGLGGLVCPSQGWSTWLLYPVLEVVRALGGSPPPLRLSSLQECGRYFWLGCYVA